MEPIRANYENTISSYHPSSGSDGFCTCLGLNSVNAQSMSIPESNMTSGTNATIGGNMTGAGNMTNESISMMTNSS